MKLWDKIGRIILNILIVIITIIAVFNVYCFITLTVLNKDYVSVFGYTYFEVASGSMEPEIGIVISNIKDAYALTRAKESKIKTYTLKDYKDEEELYKVLKKSEVDLVVLAGYLKLIPVKVIRDFTIINTHPALLPKYGGKGMYGMNVHKAVVENKESITGATLHFVNEEYDKGKIISQIKVKVLKKDTPIDVSAKVQAAEKIQLIKSLKKFSNGKIDI